MMKERPIIFNAEMVNAILGGRKIQTRRIIKPQPIRDNDAPAGFGNRWWYKGRCSEEYKGNAEMFNPFLKFCLYGIIGDRLWIKETWATYRFLDNVKPNNLCENNPMPKIWYLSDNDINTWIERHPSAAPIMNIGKTRSSRFMPRWASRINLEITNIRVERVQDISSKDQISEGVRGAERFMESGTINGKTVKRFAILWDSINAKRGYGWDKNPWVWVIEFKKINTTK